MPYLELPSTRLFFTDAGAGRTLVLLHAVSGDSNHWNWTIPLLADRYRVVALDLRGHGHSSPGAGYQLADFAGDVLAVADHLGVDRFVPVVHSLGGAIGAHLAVEHPDRVHAVVEVDAAYALPPWNVDWWEAGRARWRAQQAGRPVGAEPELPRSAVTPAFLVTWVARGMEAMDI